MDHNLCYVIFLAWNLISSSVTFKMIKYRNVYDNKLYNAIFKLIGNIVHIFFKSLLSKYLAEKLSTSDVISNNQTSISLLVFPSSRTS